jgi:cell division protein FtsZ
MRLMEVDEAANHIRELVDPDANIIWGSAFNENLNGKIRVSVVATGIDAANVVTPASQPFDFKHMGGSLRASGTFAPSAAEAAAPQPEAAPTVEEPAIVLAEMEAEPVEAQNGSEAQPLGAQPFAQPAAAEGDELFLNDRLDSLSDALDLGAVAQRIEPEAPQPAPVAAPAPVPAPAPARPAASGGGTLFERMSLLARGNTRNTAGTSEDDEPKGDFDVPRFLNRQNNQ